MDSLLGPLVQKSTSLLNVTPRGTDEAVWLTDFKKVYLSFIITTLQSGLEQIYRSECKIIIVKI